MNVSLIISCVSKTTTSKQKKKKIIRVEWPGKENQAAQPKGYVYIIFESEKQVRELLNACTIQDENDANSGNYYFKISSKRIKAKEVRLYQTSECFFSPLRFCFDAFLLAIVECYSSGSSTHRFFYSFDLLKLLCI